LTTPTATRLPARPAAAPAGGPPPATQRGGPPPNPPSFTPAAGALSLTGRFVVTAETAAWAAREVVRQHHEPPSPDRATGSCAQCQPGGGCRMLAWALAITPVSE
jgi:hypothetical protein